MARQHLAGIVLVALVAMATAFVLAAHAGLVATHGPGVKLNVRNGVPGPVTGGAGVAIEGVPVAPFMVSTRTS